MTKKTEPKSTKARRSKVPKTVLRKKPKDPSSLDHMAIVSDYTEGTLSVKEIARAHGTTDKNVGLIVNRHWKSLCNMRESRALTSLDPNLVNSRRSSNNSALIVLKELEKAKEFNDSFISELSDSEGHLLSDSESIYCWTYVHTGDSFEAIRTSGLDVGLYKEKSEVGRFSYDRALKLRSMYLHSKPNVVSYIKELRESRLIDADVGKARLQSELLEQLEQMKASGEANRLRTQILRTIELLGKTIGAFTERIEVSEVDPSNSLDKLIEMAQEAQVLEISGSEPRIPGTHRTTEAQEATVS